jgi:hypothetical protein
MIDGPTVQSSGEIKKMTDGILPVRPAICSHIFTLVIPWQGSVMVSAWKEKGGLSSAYE